MNLYYIWKIWVWILGRSWACQNYEWLIKAVLKTSVVLETIDYKTRFDWHEWDRHYTGVQGQALRWFRSYLSDRIHFVFLKRAKILDNVNNYGMQQGFVLGPLLFSINMLGSITRQNAIIYGCKQWLKWISMDTDLYMGMAMCSMKLIWSSGM